MPLGVASWSSRRRSAPTRTLMDSTCTGAISAPSGAPCGMTTPSCTKSRCRQPRAAFSSPFGQLESDSTPVPAWGTYPSLYDASPLLGRVAYTYGADPRQAVERDSGGVRGYRCDEDSA